MNKAYPHKGVRHKKLDKCWIPQPCTITIYNDPRIYLITGIFESEGSHTMNVKLIRGHDKAKAYAEKYDRVMRRVSLQVSKWFGQTYSPDHNISSPASKLFNKYYRFAGYYEVQLTKMELE